MSHLETARQFQTLIIRPTLEAIGLYTPVTEALLLGTAATESNFQYIRQVGGGPAIGYFQMERATHDDIWDHYLRFRPQWNMRARLWSHSNNTPGMPRPDADEMTWNLRYATVMARIHYLRVPQKLPDMIKPSLLGEYWKTWYNTGLGAGSVEKFVNDWHRFSLSRLYREASE